MWEKEGDICTYTIYRSEDDGVRWKRNGNEEKLAIYRQPVQNLKPILADINWFGKGERIVIPAGSRTREHYSESISRS